MLRRVLINKQENIEENSLIALTKWINSLKRIAGAEIIPLKNDASERRYFRLRKESESFIAVDASLNENCFKFIEIAKYLAKMDLCVPNIIEVDLKNSFFLVSDMGSDQYFDSFQSNADTVNELYTDAIDALLIMQNQGVVFEDSLPKYNKSLLNYELSLFKDWFCSKHLNLDFTNLEEDKWKICCDLLINNALEQRQVFVHRDYHSKNLMVMSKRSPGILDFQDAVKGPFTYDLVSLLKDSYIAWPREQVNLLANYYFENLDKNIFSSLSKEQFFIYFELMGVQRHLKVAGIFCRLNYRDGKPSYLKEINTVLNYIIEITPKYSELIFIDNLIREKIIPMLDDMK
ncbi:MAG: aminoglycoside phosphotransferase [Woeseia sp.]|nr:aminoglycoside phosphotransferase [Woeseia sp.]